MQDIYVNPFTDFDPAERKAYQDSLKYYRDLKNVTDTAWGEGLEEGHEKGFEEGLEKGLQKGLQKGREEERQVVASKLLNSLEDAAIAEITGLTKDEVAKLRGFS